MATKKASAKFVVVKTYTRELSADMTASGKREFISDKLYYYHGTWLADWCNAKAQLFDLKEAKALVIRLDNECPNTTFDWINTNAVKFANWDYIKQRSN